MQIFVPRFVSNFQNSLQIYNKHFIFSKCFDKNRKFSCTFQKKVVPLRTFMQSNNTNGIQMAF